ncbi:hypothetical protein BDU57DRAFT_521006 [Ampelomyces quisqualis]|uniref:Uncharacterized protein n=1 Tax=Ampelomyces quisqualis TaxID=50730 RepID=A0A6A5QGT3_AMPQU|nr:hypothetical protein BDU57DRAFT_521006 [Ampelomyces quisqualis]
MAYHYGRLASDSVPNVIEISDSEDTDSIMEAEVAQQKADRRRLAQALNYLQLEGGNDSPATFIDRVNRIDRALLKRLPYPGHSFDDDIYHQVQTMVKKVQRDFEDAADEPSYDFESDNDIPEGFFPIEALYRGESPSPSPIPMPSVPRATKGRATGLGSREIDNDVQRTRVFKYGGPDNEAEHWHSNAPPSLPFPETHLMAHWESLKIDYDLSRPTDAKHTETNVPFDHPALQPYFNLPQYESGSRFKLPTVSAKDQSAISRYGTSDRLANVVEGLNKVDATEGGNKGYTRRVFLEKFLVGSQKFPKIVSPSQLRSAMAFTPSKSRTTRVSSQAPISVIKLPTSTPRAEEVPVTKTKITQGNVYTSPAFRRISNEVRLAEKAEARTAIAAVKTASLPSAISKPKPTRVAVPPTEKAQVKPKLTTLPPTASKPQPTRVATHVLIPKRGRGRPRKDATKAVPPAPSIRATPVAEPAPTSLGKRKPSIGSQPYHDPTQGSSIKKVLRDRPAKKQKITQFDVAPITLEQDTADPRFVARPVKKLVRGRAKGLEEKMKGKGPSKASVAGALAKAGRAKEGKKEGRFPIRGEKVGPRTTRSGVRYTI